MLKKLGRGFTLVEVTIVLAIGGLIFAMVFLILPSVQRNQRDNHRELDALAILKALTHYASDHYGQYPANWTQFKTSAYFPNGHFTDPSTGTSYYGPSDASTWKLGNGTLTPDDCTAKWGGWNPGGGLNPPAVMEVVINRNRDVWIRVCTETGGSRDARNQP